MAEGRESKDERLEKLRDKFRIQQAQAESSASPPVKKARHSYDNGAIDLTDSIDEAIVVTSVAEQPPRAANVKVEGRRDPVIIKDALGYGGGRSMRDGTNLEFKMQVFKQSSHRCISDLKDHYARCAIEQQRNEYQQIEQENRRAIEESRRHAMLGDENMYDSMNNENHIHLSPTSNANHFRPNSSNFMTINAHENNSDNWVKGTMNSTAGRTPPPSKSHYFTNDDGDDSPLPRSPNIDSPTNSPQHTPLTPTVDFMNDLRTEIGLPLESRSTVNSLVIEESIDTAEWTDFNNMKWHLNIVPVGSRDIPSLSMFAFFNHKENVIPDEGVRISFDAAILPCNEFNHKGERLLPINKHWNKVWGDPKKSNLHTYDKECPVTNWGYPDFALVSDLFPNYIDPEGMIHIKLDYNIIRTPKRSDTGMVGLDNQGATCYMNSLLQVLYHLRVFRRLIYAAASDKSFQQPQHPNSPPAPTGPTDSPLSSKRDKEMQREITEALAVTFHSMQTNPLSINTTTLTRSFGWDGMDAYVQQDLHELARLLFDQVEGRISETPHKGLLENLFQGKQRSYIECKNVTYTSSRIEVFSDIQLDVKDCENLKDSFAKYIETETLDGDNQYDTDDGGFGKQDAEKGVIFESFPPILSLHLKRFEFDLTTMEKAKIEDRLEFPLELNISDYLHKKPSTEDAATYHLYSIIVHEGGINHGHYYSYIRPKISSYYQEDPSKREWFKFNDDVVSLVDSEEDMLESVYGPSGNSNTSRPPTAYMLTYIRDSDLRRVLGDKKDVGSSQDMYSTTMEPTKFGFNPPADDDIPPEFQTVLNERQDKRSKKRQEKKNKEGSFKVRIVTDDDVNRFNLSSDSTNSISIVDRIDQTNDSGHASFTVEPHTIQNYLFDFETVRTIEATLRDTGFDLIRKAAEKFNVPTYCLRLWQMDHGPDDEMATITVSRVLSPIDLHKTVQHFFGVDKLPFLYLEVMSKDNDIFTLLPRDEQNVKSIFASPPKSSVDLTSESTSYLDLVPQEIASILLECDDFDWQNNPLGTKISEENLEAIQEGYEPKDEDSGEVLCESLLFIKQFQAKRDQDGNIIESYEGTLNFIGKAIIRTAKFELIDRRVDSKMILLDFQCKLDNEHVSNLTRAAISLSNSCSSDLASSGVLNAASEKLYIYHIIPPRARQHVKTLKWRRTSEELRRCYPVYDEPKRQHKGAISGAISTGSVLIFQDGSLIDEFYKMTSTTQPNPRAETEDKIGSLLPSLNLPALCTSLSKRDKITILPLTAKDASYLRSGSSDEGIFQNLKKEIVGIIPNDKNNTFTVEQFVKMLARHHFIDEIAEEPTKLRLVKLNFDEDDFRQPNMFPSVPEPDTKATKILDATHYKDEILSKTTWDYFDVKNSKSQMCYVGDQFLKRRYCFFHISSFELSKIEMLENSPDLTDHDSFYSTTVIAASSELRELWEKYELDCAKRSPRFWLPLVERPVIVHKNSSVGDIAGMFCANLGEDEGTLARRLRIFHIANGKIVANPGQHIWAPSIISANKIAGKCLGKISDHKSGGKEWDGRARLGNFAEHTFLAELVSEEEDAMWEEQFPGDQVQEGMLTKVVPIQVVFLSDDKLRPGDQLPVAVPMLTFLRMNEDSRTLKTRIGERLGCNLDSPDWELRIVPPRDDSHKWEEPSVNVDDDEGPTKSLLWTYLESIFRSMFGRSSGLRYRMMARKAFEERNREGWRENESFQDCPTVGFLLNDLQLDQMKRARTHLCFGSAGLEFDKHGMCVETEAGEEPFSSSVNRTGNRGGIQFKDSGRDRGMSI